MLSTIKLYAGLVLSGIVAVFIFIFKARGRKIKKQAKKIKGHNAKERITTSNIKRTEASRESKKKTKEATDNEATVKANSRNS